MLRVSSVGSGWCSADRGGVFASPSPQTAELIAKLFAFERDCFHPFQLQFIGAFEGVFVFGQSGRVVEVGHIQRAIIHILIRLTPFAAGIFSHRQTQSLHQGDQSPMKELGVVALMTDRSSCQTDAVCRLLQYQQRFSMALMFMGKDIFFPVFIRTTLTLKLRKPGAFLAQCEG